MCSCNRFLFYRPNLSSQRITLFTKAFIICCGSFCNAERICAIISARDSPIRCLHSSAVIFVDTSASSCSSFSSFIFVDIVVMPLPIASRKFSICFSSCIFCLFSTARTDVSFNLSFWLSINLSAICSITLLWFTDNVRSRKPLQASLRLFSLSKMTKKSNRLFT